VSTSGGIIRKTEANSQDSTLKVLSTSTSVAGDGFWRGRMMVGAENKTFILGATQGMCALGAHSWTSANSEAGAAWEDVYINPDGDKTIYLGGHGWTAGTGILQVRNSDDKVLYNGSEVAVKSDIPIVVSAVTENSPNAVSSGAVYEMSLQLMTSILTRQALITQSSDGGFEIKNTLGTVTSTIYPPTSAGTAGQVWVSDGSGPGAWRSLVTISTAEPSGGQDGDLWFQYEE
jgi:hypothetical protein